MAFKRSAVRSRLSPPNNKGTPFGVPLLFGGDPAGRPRVAKATRGQITRIFGKTPSCRVPPSGTALSGRKMRGFTERHKKAAEYPAYPTTHKPFCLGAEFPLLSYGDHHCSAFFYPLKCGYYFGIISA